MKSFLTFFVVTMSPRTLKSSIFWGLVYLLVDVSFDMTEMNNNKLKEDVIEMLEKVTRSLEECKRAHQNTQFDEDLKLILNDAFIALILFWADTVNFMRAYPNGKDEQGASYDYEREIKKVNGTFDHLKVCATMPESGPNLSVIPSGVPLRSLLPKDLSLPCGKAPYYSDVDFYGRQVELEKINSALGVGKSKLAMAYAKKYARQFDVILWIKAQTALSLSQSFTEIASELRLPGARSNSEENQQLILDFLKLNSGRWLIIWDNVETYVSVAQHLKDLTWNSKSASMLITTRYPKELAFFRSRGGTLNLAKFSLADSKELFLKSLGPDYHHITDNPEELKAAEMLLRKVDGLAIGICTIATRIASQSQSIQTFLKRYHKGELGSAKGELADYDLTLETIWSESFDILEKEERRGQIYSFRLLGILSFCSPDSIPRELFMSEDYEILHDAPNFCEDSEKYEVAMGSLRDQGLINSNPGFTGVTIHRLVQSAFLNDLTDETAQRFFDLAVTLVHHAFPKQVEGRPLHLYWDKCHIFIQHGVWLANVYADSLTSKRKLHPSQKFSELLSNCICEIVLMAIDPTTYLYAHLPNSLLATAWLKNELRNAFAHSDVVLSAMKPHREETSEEYVGILSNQANLLASNRDDEKALQLLLQVEDTRRQFHLPENIALAFVHLAIGRLRCRMGDLKDAEVRFYNAREIVRREHGENGQYTQHVYFELGNLAVRKENLQEAERCYVTGQEMQREENKHDIFMASFLYKRACVNMKLEDLKTAK
ncbi:hypothetical protein MKX08_004799 [Trichoderma sp. CBMAI-0020]|nr:hypothetical protein MKX08_004799 [Trichoderma sp. CBMAI-0020]